VVGPVFMRTRDDRTVAMPEAERREVAELPGLRGFSGACEQPASATRYSWRVEAVLSVLQVIFAVVLIFLVLMHSGKDAGLSGAFGVGSGTGPLGGGSLVERNLNRWTIFFAVLFFLNAFILLKSS
jgi:preprotein translocase subunit SecG